MNPLDNFVPFLVWTFAALGCATPSPEMQPTRVERSVSLRIEYHLAERHLSLDRAEFERRVQRRLGREVPKGSTLSFFLREERPGGEILHDRFVLTEHGGVNFSVGLDEGEPGQTTKVSRLSRPAHEKVSRDYATATSAFNLRHSFNVAPRPMT